MGEENVELIEQDMGHLKEDMRETKKRLDKMEGEVNQLISSNQLMQQSQTHLMENMSELKGSIKVLSDKWDEKWEKEDLRREKEKEEQLSRYKDEKADRAKEMRNFGWKVFAGIIIAGASLLLTLI